MFFAGDIGSSLIRITDFGENITYWLSAKEADENEKWRSAFKKERQIVANESTNGMVSIRFGPALHIGNYSGNANILLGTILRLELC